MKDIIREVKKDKLVITHPSGQVSEYSAAELERKIKFIDSEISRLNDEKNELVTDLEKMKN